MSSLNRVQLIGRLGQDPEVKTMQSGDEVANLSLATSESWKDKATGEKKERTQWHRIVIFNQGLVKIAKNYLKKGGLIYIEGQLETRKWTDQSSSDKYVTEIVLRPFNGEIVMLGSKGGGGPPAADNPDSYGSTKTAGASQENFDDEIPF